MATHNGKYDPSEFVVPSFDLDGHSKRICVRIQLLVDDALDEVMKSRKFPFKTKDGVIRWCLLEGLKTLQSMERCISSMPLINITVILARANFDLDTHREFFDAMGGAIFHLLTSGYQTASANRLVNAMWELVLSMPSSRHRNLYLRGLRERWGHLLIETADEPTLSETEHSGGR